MATASPSGAWLLEQAKGMNVNGQEPQSAEPILDPQHGGFFNPNATSHIAEPAPLNEAPPKPRRHSKMGRPTGPGSWAIHSLGMQEKFFYVPTESMAQLVQQVERVARQDTTLLLTGETGTGKTHLARQIHGLSPRCREPFMVVNCGALSANLIESEMFGHVCGAFTGADRDRIGKFAAVGRGTLLLDEIDALPVELQAKLLRVVDERCFEPVGSNRVLAMEARLIAASNRTLGDEVAAGRFRADLHFRINVVEFQLLPLRQRRELIPYLVTRLFHDFAGSTGRNVCNIADKAMAALQQYAWPGNIRELRNVVERAIALCPGQEIQLKDLPDAVCHRQSLIAPCSRARLC